jgi:hypothetical protein
MRILYLDMDSHRPSVFTILQFLRHKHTIGVFNVIRNGRQVSNPNCTYSFLAASKPSVDPVSKLSRP